MSIFQAAAIAVTGAMMAVALKSFRPELAMGIALVTGIILLSGAITGIKGIFDEIAVLAEKSGIESEYITVTVKVIGIAYITQFASEICRDSGQGGIAAKLDTVGKTAVMIMAVPMIRRFFDLIISML